MSAAADAPIAGRFELVELLGSGGSAAVYAAIDLSSGDEVALRVLHSHLAADDGARDAFLAEFRRVEGLRHPNLVSVVAAGIDESTGEPVTWMAMERARGVTLSALATSGNRLRVTEALAVADAVLAALEVVHAAGLVHRDITPSNVMVDVDDSGRVSADGVRLIDFGLADVIGSNSIAGTDAAGVAGTATAVAAATAGAGPTLSVRGSAAYVSPEQALGRPIDERGDLYQVGALLYFALIGRPPFRRPTVEALVRAHLAAPPPLPSVSDPSIPASVDHIVVRALLKNPAARHVSATAMREDVRAALGGAASARPSAGVTDATDDGETRVLPMATAVRTGEDATSVIGVAALGSGGAGRPGARPGRRAGRARRSGSPRPTRRRRSAAPWAVAAAVAAGLVVSWAVASSADPAPPPLATASARPTQAAPAPAQPTGQPIVDDDAASVPVPALLGLSLGEARAALAAAGLVIGVVSTTDAATAADTVLASAPAIGAAVDAHAAIDLTVASGSNMVPDVAGATVIDASAALIAAGFAVHAASGDTVQSTDPAAGTRLPLGTSVQLRTMPAVPAPPTSEPTPPITPTPSSTPVPSATPMPTPSAPPAP